MSGLEPGGPASAFDFWLGTWDATWEGGYGRNAVTREYGGHAIIERFEAEVPEPFQGTSLSVFDPIEGCWRQLWVDSQGGQWSFTGGPSAEGFVLSTRERTDGGTVLKRMVFSNVRDDAFDWRWERSDDGGVVWRQLWTIRYRRRGVATTQRSKEEAAAVPR